MFPLFAVLRKLSTGEKPGMSRIQRDFGVFNIGNSEKDFRNFSFSKKKEKKGFSTFLSHVFSYFFTGKSGKFFPETLPIPALQEFSTVSPTPTNVTSENIYIIYLIKKGSGDLPLVELMKIIFNKQKMSSAVAPLMCAVSGKSTLTSIEGILIEAKAPDTCVMTTYDLEKGIRITTEAEVVEEGTYIINAQKFNQTLKVMDGDEITLTVDDKNCASIESGKSVHKMNALPGSDFPLIPRLESDRSFSLSQGKLKSMLNKVMYAIGVNDQRPVLNGCYFAVSSGTLLLVSCDSYKLAKCSLATDIKNTGNEGTVVDFNFIVPVKTVNELYRMLDDDDEAEVKIVMTRKNIIFLLGDVLFFSRLVDGVYIDYERIIIKNHKITVKIDHDALLAALERAALITEERIAGSVRSSVRLQLEGNLLKVMAASGAGSTYDEIAVEHEGEDILIAFNNRYLMDSVRACTADTILISMSSPLTSINIEPAYEREGIEEKFMLLPVKMTN